MTSIERRDHLVDETSRLRDLYALDLLGNSPDEWLDRITKITAQALNVPIALITLLDSDDQWFCASFGTDIEHTTREQSFCTHTIAQPKPVMVVPDTLLDDRFRDLRLVTHEPHVRFYAGAPISTDGRTPVGTLCVLDVESRQFDDDERQLLQDLAALVEHELRNASLVLTDDLTGLANRRSFVATTAGFLGLGHRHSRSVSVVFADIDGLKEVNDLAGHTAGDALVRRAAAVISDSRRASDLVARIGGDEFAIVLFDADADVAAGVIDSIRRRLAEENDNRPDDDVLSISFGAATALESETVTELIARADSAMYVDKRSDVPVARNDGAHGRQNPTP